MMEKEQGLQQHLKADIIGLVCPRNKKKKQTAGQLWVLVYLRNKYMYSLRIVSSHFKKIDNS